MMYMIYGASSGFVNLDSARQSPIVPNDEALPQVGRVRRRSDWAKSQQV